MFIRMIFREYLICCISDTMLDNSLLCCTFIDMGNPRNLRTLILHNVNDSTIIRFCQILINLKHLIVNMTVFSGKINDFLPID